MLNLENWLRSFSQTGQYAANIYGSIVAQTRQTLFYTHYGVQDTTTGRYELLVLHVAVVLAALRDYEPVNGPLSRGVVEAFVTDMDDNLRELGVGDMSVPKRVKKASAGLLERCGDYIDSLKNNDKSALLQHLERHFDGQKTELTAQLLTQYIFAVYGEIKNQADIKKQGVITFPDPATHMSV